MAVIAGILGLAFGGWRTSPGPLRRAAALVGLFGALAIVALNIGDGLKARHTNSTRDAAWATESEQITADRQSIDSALKENPEHAGQYLDSSIRARINDRDFVIAALPHDSISPGILDTLASSPDLGIALEAVRSPATSAETLTRVYRTHANPDYFFQALAVHRHTPPDILRELYQHPGTMSDLDRWLAVNPATPHDVLEQIATTSTDNDVIGQLLANPALDCDLLTQIGVRLTKPPMRDPSNPNVARATELLPDVCLAKAKL